MAFRNSADSQIANPVMVTEEEGEANEIGLVEESAMEGNMDLSAETDSACGQ